MLFKQLILLAVAVTTIAAPVPSVEPFGLATAGPDNSKTSEAVSAELEPTLLSRDVEDETLLPLPESPVVPPHPKRQNGQNGPRPGQRQGQAQAQNQAQPPPQQQQQQQNPPPNQNQNQNRPPRPPREKRQEDAHPNAATPPAATPPPAASSPAPPPPPTAPSDTGPTPQLIARQGQGAQGPQNQQGQAPPPPTSTPPPPPPAATPQRQNNGPNPH